MQHRMTLAACALLCLVGIASAQRGTPNQTPATSVSGAPINRSTVNVSVVIASGTTFQTILAAQTTTDIRQSLTIQNNQTSTDNCWIYLGTGTPTTANSILLTPGQAYTRYWPFVPSDVIKGTCATTEDTLYVDHQ